MRRDLKELSLMSITNDHSLEEADFCWELKK
jgi:hypothetical protein